MAPKLARTKALKGETIKMNSPCGELFVTLNDDPLTNDLAEIFVRFGKSGTCASLVANALTIITSYGLRSGMDVSDAIKGMIGHSCHRPPVFDQNGQKIVSCVDAIGKAMRLHAGLESGEDDEDEPADGLRLAS